MSTEQSMLIRQVVLVGYGRVGRRIGKTLLEQKIPFVVAEQNREIVESLRKDGMPAVSGDASEPEVLIQAHIARAAILVIAIPDMLNVRKMIDIARTLNPTVSVILRAHDEEEAALLRKEYPVEIFLGEHELARNMVSHVVTRMRGN
jgi:CPA2 family monovalent cation:H+ antiporter-2